MPLNDPEPIIPADFKKAIDNVLHYNPGPKVLFQIKKEDPKIIELVEMVTKYSDMFKERINCN